MWHSRSHAEAGCSSINQKLLEETLFVSDSSRLDQDSNSSPKNDQVRAHQERLR
jgi:hypothetical protein